MKGKELPEGWEWKRLGDAIDYQKGKKPNLLEELPHPTSLPYLSADFLRTAKSTQFIPESELNSCITANNQDILLIWDGSNSGEVFLGTDGVVSSTMAKIKPKTTNLLQQYLFYFLKTQFDILNGGTNGSSIPHVSKSLFENICLLLPPLPIQRQIVAMLEQAGVLKRQRQEADALTGALLQSMFYEMFGDPVRNEKGWKARKLKDISEVVSGVTKGRKFNGKSTVFVPYLRVANVQDGFLDLSEIKDIEVLESEVEKFQLKKGDVILTEGGDRDKLGRGHVWHEEIPHCIHQNHIFRIRLNENLLNPEFFSFLIGSAYGKKYFAKSAKQTTGIASINSTQLKNFPALIPPLALQQQFARIVEEVERVRGRQAESGKEIDALCGGLMQRAFGGELAI